MGKTFKSSEEKGEKEMAVSNPMRLVEGAIVLVSDLEGEARWKAECWTRSGQSAIGKAFSIRLKNGSRVSGKVSKVEVRSVRVRQCSYIAQWSVWLTTESGFEHGPLTVEKIPR